MWRTLSLFCVLSACIGCASSTTRVNTDTDREVTVSYDWSDIDYAIVEVADSLLKSTRLKVDGRETPMVAIGRVTNDTCQHLDTMLITEKLVEVLLASDRFDVTAAFADRDEGREAMIGSVREARDNQEFDQTTVQQKGQLRAPDFSIMGKLTQQNVRTDDGGLRIEYFLELRATRLKDGATVWQTTNRRVKAVADGMPVW